MPTPDTCPACGAAGMSVFYRVNDVPVHSVLLLPTREEALRYPTGQIALAFCAQCGFISNAAFDPSLHEYSARYEATQSYSPTFSAFATRLAQRLVDEYDLHGKQIIEIGCGQGEFITELCELGDNRGTGFDPAYVEERAIRPPAKGRITFIPDFYSEQYTATPADFVCCKMTLEHIAPVAEFVATVRRSLGDRAETVVFFQVPNAARVLDDAAFWDVYYEHCSYFSLGSLGRLFRRCGFDVIRLGTDYDDQYLMIEARPVLGDPSAPLPEEDDLDAMQQAVARFAGEVPARLADWQAQIAAWRQQGQRVAIWGGGSKGVAFLTTLGLGDEAVACAVDINPHKNGMFMAGTGQPTVAPEFLQTLRPEVVIVMNPIYCAEIQHTLDRLGLAARLVPVV